MLISVGEMSLSIISLNKLFLSFFFWDFDHVYISSNVDVPEIPQCSVFFFILFPPNLVVSAF
jgi:hypothetical protein